MEIWTPVMGEMLVVKIDPMTDMIYMQWPSTDYRDAKIISHVLYNQAPRNVSIFYERKHSICRNHRSQSQQGSWLWSHVSTIYMDLTFMLKMKALAESLLADGHYNLCNSDFAQCF